MRLWLFAVIAALTPGPLLAGSFDLSLDETNGERIVAVARSGGGAFAVASGAEDLKVLKGEDAERAFAKLTALESDEAGAGDANRGNQKKRIVIHKMTIDDDDDGAENTARISKKSDGDDLEDLLILKFDEDNEAGPEEAVKRTVIRMKGVDNARAIKFIDDTTGLDAGEKAEMKASLAL